ncbi:MULTISPECIES: hypothetical protein [unclassified Streptococcus]|uniref:hypothetical protein n=1 Tax=unclassified Streptococcus TaxID=2608887 RepID=UPI0018AADBD3|nr:MULTISPECIES: hypothetical protein [unclassified Streptococcus]MBF8971027.1 hypothetical protein [Streptococcus sp. NLN76]MBG9368131.1 hypothetical protein [Streptococcus sp. NLN64]
MAKQEKEKKQTEKKSLSKGIRWKRSTFELMAGAVILLCAVWVFVSGIPMKGKVSLNDGKIIYEGTLVRGKMTGQGKATYENGDVYEGEFENGAFQGQGTFTSKDGWRYTGQFANGKPDGKGELVTEDKVAYTGTFKQGIYQNEN